MSWFCMVPDALLNILLSEWCELELLAKLDSAVCNSEIRSSFLSLMSSNEFVIDHLITDEIIGRVDWICLRTIGVKKFHFKSVPDCLINCSDCKVKSKVEYLVFDQSLMFVQCDGYSTASFLSSFPALTSLHMHSIKTVVQILIDKNVWRGLSELSVCYSYPMKPFEQVLQLIGSVCYTLTSLILAYTSDGEMGYSKLIALIISNNQLLEKIEIIGGYCENSASILSTIVTYCPKMQSVHIRLCQHDPMDLSECVYFVNHCKYTDCNILLLGLNFMATSEKRKVTIWGRNTINAQRFLRDVRDIHFFTLGNFVDLPLNNLISAQSRMVELNLNRCTFSLIEITKLIRDCKHLRQLNLHGCDGLSDVDYVTILSCENQIERLSLKSDILTLATVIRILDICPAVTTLYVESVLIPNPRDSIINVLPADRYIKWKSMRYDE